MLQTPYIKEIIKYAMAAAIVYSIAAWFYIAAVSFSESWVLYLGNFLFAAVIGIFIAWLNKKKEKGMGIFKMAMTAGKTVVAGIILSCLSCFFLLWIFMPGVFRPVAASHIRLQAAPAQFSGKNQGYALILFFNAVVGNAGTAFFIALLLPFIMMRNQRDDENS